MDELTLGEAISRLKELRKQINMSDFNPEKKEIGMSMLELIDCIGIPELLDSDYFMIGEYEA